MIPLELSSGYWKVVSIEEVKGYSENRKQFKNLRTCGVVFVGRAYEIKYHNKLRTREMREIYRPGGKNIYGDSYAVQKEFNMHSQSLVYEKETK